MDYCFTCAGNGLPTKECPECKRPARNTVVNIDDVKDKETFVKNAGKIDVPEKYIGVFWSAGELEKSHKELLGTKFGIDGRVDDHNFIRYVSFLSKIDAAFSSKRIPASSAMIVSPIGFSKEVFAYSCMQKAMQNGFSVAPLLNTVELKRILMLSGEKPDYKLNGIIDYDSYIMSDVCFISVTKMRAREWAYESIQELIDIRSRKGLATFIISRYGREEISNRDRSNSFEVLTTTNTSQDTYKYPAYFHYRGGVL